MRGLLALVAAAVAALLLVAAASADPPPLLAVGIDGLHPTASFAIGRAVFATIAVSRTPDRAPDGSFAAPLDQVALTPDEIAAGTWRDPNELEPGTYWVLLHADADIDTCFLLGDGWDASCPDGWSAQPLQLVVTTPTPRYAAAVSLARRAGIARLRLTATPLGASLPYRVCFDVRGGGRHCANGTVDGTSWDSPATAVLTVPLRSLAPVTRVTWLVDGRPVAAASARVVRTPARRARAGRP